MDEPGIRQAARIIVVDDSLRVLLIRIPSSPKRPDTPLWFTPGGGIEPGEEDGLLAGVRNVGYDNVVIRNGTVRNFGYGVRLMAGATYNVVANMTLAGNVNAGVELFDADDGRNGNTVRTNTFEGNGFGLLVTEGSENSVIANNRFLGNGNLAIYLYDSTGHRIEGNYVSGVTSNPLLDSDGGIELEASSDNLLIDNFLADTGDSGIALRAGSNRNLIQGNSKSITAMHVSKCCRLGGDGVRRGWGSMSAWMPQAKADARGGCRLRTRPVKLAGDLCGKLCARYRMRRSALQTEWLYCLAAGLLQSDPQIILTAYAVKGWTL